MFAPFWEKTSRIYVKSEQQLTVQLYKTDQFINTRSTNTEIQPSQRFIWLHNHLQVSNGINGMRLIKKKYEHPEPSCFGRVKIQARGYTRFSPHAHGIMMQTTAPPPTPKHHSRQS